MSLAYISPTPLPQYRILATLLPDSQHSKLINLGTFIIYFIFFKFYTISTAPYIVVASEALGRVV